MNDFIRRQDAIDAIDKRIDEIWKDNNPKMRGRHPENDLYGIKRHIYGIPAAYVRDIYVGKWVNIRGDNCGDCDQCRHTGYVWMNFCPICGADMRGEKSDRLNQQTGGD